MSVRPRSIVLGTAVACTLVVGLDAFPGLELRSYGSPPLRIALETAATLAGLLAAYLVFGRFRERGRTSDFLLVVALELMAFRSLFFAAYPAVSESELGRFATWSQAAGALLAAAVFATAAFAPDTPIRRRRGVMALLLVPPVVIGTVATIEAIVVPELPVGFERPTGQPGYVALQLTAAGFHWLAAIGFVRRAERGPDELVRWLAAAATVAGFSRLDVALFRPADDERVYSGDALRLGVFVLLVLGAAREIRAYWRHRAEVAVLEERRRIARDLHDGLAQELAFVSSQARRAAQGLDAAGPAQLAAAAERALDESRRAIAALTRRVDEPIDVALAQAAEEAAHRAGSRVTLDLAPGLEVTAAVREALVRITREAVTNAARHGRARRIAVRLARGEGILLRVEDDGTGFEPAAIPPTGDGFGLVSMRERAEGLGGTFSVASRPGAGSVVEVVIP